MDFHREHAPGLVSGHSWLRDDNGIVLFTIDITLDQFAEWDDWYFCGPRSYAGERELRSLNLCRAVAKLARDGEAPDR